MNRSGKFGKQGRQVLGRACDFCDDRTLVCVRLVQPCGVVFRCCLRCAAKVAPELAARKAAAAAPLPEQNVTVAGAAPGRHEKAGLVSPGA
jgi:hypothetical protein